MAGNSSYLAPYHAAVAEIRQTRLTLERMVVIPKEAQTLNVLMQKVDEKLLELQQTISLMTAGDQEQALQIIRSGDGKDLMNQIRQAAFEFSNLQDQRLRELRQDHANAIDRTYIAMGMSLVSNISLLILLLARTAVFTRRVQSNQEELHKRNLELIELAQKTKDHNLHMQKLSELGSFLQACIDTEEANKFLAERLPELLKARSGALYAMAASRNQLQLAFFWGTKNTLISSSRMNAGHCEAASLLCSLKARERAHASTCMPWKVLNARVCNVCLSLRTENSLAW